MLRPILVTTFAALLLLTPQAPAAVVAEGRFGPTQKYTGTGRAIVESSGGTRTLRLSRDFSASAAIRLRMYLATTPSARAHIDLGPMTRRRAELPAPAVGEHPPLPIRRRVVRGRGRAGHARSPTLNAVASRSASSSTTTARRPA